ncbi:MAG: hypothetical protein LCH85_18920 [Chloroflexi bacterium]|nr:hypothetical protein [Chloroflexota bacterium]
MLALTGFGDSDDSSMYIAVIPDFKHGTVQRIPTLPTIKHWLSPYWSPTGDRLLITGVDLQGQYQLYQIDYRTLTTTPLIVPHSYCYGLGWFPDGEHIAFFAMDNDDWTINRLNCQTGKSTLISSVRNTAFAWSPDWKHLIRALPNTNELIITDALGIQLEHTIPIHGQLTQIDCSPNNQSMACSFSSETGRSLEIFTLNGERIHTISSIEYESPIAWSPSSSFVAYLSRQTNGAFLNILNIQTGDQQAICPIDPDDYSGEMLPTKPVWMTPDDTLLISSIIGDGHRLLIYSPLTNSLSNCTPPGAPLCMVDLAWYPRLLDSESSVVR